MFCVTKIHYKLDKHCTGLRFFPTGYAGKLESGKENAYSCVVLAGMRDKEQRRRNLEAFKTGDVRFLICTDVAARGLDIAGLPYVINVTLPDDIENYVHRVGRVGRVDKLGLAISLVSTVKEKVWYHKNCKNRGKDCKPEPGNTALTIPFGPDGKLMRADKMRDWIVEEKGCATWYNEPKLLDGIQNRLKTKLKKMDPVDFSVPGILKSPLLRRKPEDTAQLPIAKVKMGRRAKNTPVVEVQYGSEMNGAAQKRQAQQVTAISGLSAELWRLERSVTTAWQITKKGLGFTPGEKEKANEIIPSGEGGEKLSAADEASRKKAEKEARAGLARRGCRRRCCCCWRRLGRGRLERRRLGRVRLGRRGN